MTSGDHSPSHSEGEYISSDPDVKAIKPPSHRRDYDVDRHSRKNASVPDRRSRSRSPYRAPRGEKRRREDDHAPRHDPRKFSVRYDEDKQERHSLHDDRRSKRSRTFSPDRSRSRSPYRRQSRAKNDAHIRTAAVAFHGERESENRNDLTTKLTKTSERNTGTRGVKALNGISPSGGVAADKTETSIHSSHTGETASIVDEAALIEARRKRREAIKNKYKGQEPSLLVQALKVGTDGPNGSVEATPTRSVSPLPSTTPGSAPGTPKSFVSAPQSPGGKSSTNDEDMFSGDADSPLHVDEPSAADYDPTVDMQEERARHDKRLFKEDDHSVEAADQQVLEQSDLPPKDNTGDELDMFAEGDDDMFAEFPTNKPANTDRTAKTLNVNMLDNWDDHEGYYLTILGELIDNRYKVMQNLGRGMFASVIRAADAKTDQLVAIKIIRNNDSMRKAGVKEIDILQTLAANDPEDKMQVVRLLRSFDHKGHLCMVFENLSMNLREVLKKYGRDVGISLKGIRAYSQQLFRGLGLLKKCQLLHADLKPDNILVNESRSFVKIADLGSASPITENVTAPYLVSRYYRAPEVILGITYDYGIDMWSIGCTLFELYTGKILFTGRNNNNMLRTIMECRGKFPNKLLRKGSLTYDYFDDLLNFKAIEPDKITGKMVAKTVDIKAKPVRDLRSRLMPKGKRIDEDEKRELEQFLDLLDKCLTLSPEKRITPNEALRHPFIARTK